MIGENYGMKPVKREVEKLPYRSDHPMIKSWEFETRAECDLAESCAVIAERNGIDVNEFRYSFTSILRMLKHESEWSK